MIKKNKKQNKFIFLKKAISSFQKANTREKHAFGGCGMRENIKILI
jgi:3-deoxy-D-manno-octulosonic acid (KDO) 8-phosphate synthase